MKKLFSILTVMLVAVVLLSACKKEVDARDGWVGTYNTTWYKDGIAMENYPLTISKSNVNSSGINMANFLNMNKWTVLAIVNDNYISYSFVSDDGSLQGSATRSGNIINFQISVTFTGYAPLNVTQTAIKQ